MAAVSTLGSFNKPEFSFLIVLFDIRMTTILSAKIGFAYSALVAYHHDSPTMYT